MRDQRRKGPVSSRAEPITDVKRAETSWEAQFVVLVATTHNKGHRLSFSAELLDKYYQSLRERPTQEFP
jgi:hypothetical protein